MKVMVIVKATASSEAGEMPDPALMEAMGKYNEELVKAGIMQNGDGLKPSKEGFRVRFDGNSREVNRGPFSATSELIAGFWIWEVESKEEALKWAKRAPMEDGATLEIRKLFEAADFGAEVEAHEAKLREKMQQRG